jgi:NTP pyrophosphatase (non-canonical NTP hydrolase)
MGMAGQHPVLKNHPTLHDIQVYVGGVLRHRGFDKQSLEYEFAMLVEEVGELAKALRQQGGGYTATDSKALQVRHEAADVLWMLVCVCNRLDIDLEAALREKEEHNKTRTWKQ